MGQVLRTGDVENLFDLLISKIVKTLKINQGGIFITSGLGNTPLKTVFIQPLIRKGVLELGSFRPFEAHEVEFLQELPTMLAGFISGHRVNQKNKSLLEESIYRGASGAQIRGF